MLKIDENQTVRKYEYILKWSDLVEKYVKYNAVKSEYEEVTVRESQIFKTIAEAEEFVNTMVEDGYIKPEIIKMICKAIA
jgi:DNA-binding transcriptional regulator YhcF (GntR family)